MAVFPSALNDRAWLVGYTIAPVTHIARTENTAGIPRQRKSISCRDIIVTCSMMLDDSELSIFEAFYFDEIGGGADEFTGPFYDGAGVKRFGLMQIIGGDYSAQRIVLGSYRVSMSLLIQDRAQEYESEIADLFSGTITYEQYLEAVL